MLSNQQPGNLFSQYSTITHSQLDKNHQ